MSEAQAEAAAARDTARRGPWRTVLWVVAVAGVVALAATARVVVAGEGEIAASTAALKAGDAREAIAHARRAAGWYAPGAPHVRVAYQRLVVLATTAEGLGDRDTALYAWNAVRSSAIETRWLVTPHADDLARADQAIARLHTATPRPPGTRVDPPDVVLARELEALSRNDAPRVGWVVALVLAFAAWCGGAVWVVRRAVDATGRLVLAKATPGIAVAVGGVLLWLLAVWQA